MTFSWAVLGLAVSTLRPRIYIQDHLCCLTSKVDQRNNISLVSCYAFFPLAISPSIYIHVYVYIPLYRKFTCNRANGCSTTFMHAIACVRRYARAHVPSVCHVCAAINEDRITDSETDLRPLWHRHMINDAHFRISLCNIALSI